MIAFRFRSVSIATVAVALFWALSTSIHAADDNRPVVDDSKFAVDHPEKDKLPSLFLVGDSTMNSNAPLRGWAQEMPAFFDPKKIHVINRAIGGRSSKTFIAEGKWDKVLSEIRPGDIVVVQFGHNDAGKYDDPAAKGRPSLHGDGEETVEFKKPDGTTETIHTFGWYMRKYATDAKAKGAKVVLCSMVPHKDWRDGKIVRNEQQTFVRWTESAAKATGAQFIDLNEQIAQRLEQLGQAKVEALFGDRRTHSTPEGAQFNAAAVVAGMKALQPDPLAGFYAAVEPSTQPALMPATNP